MALVIGLLTVRSSHSSVAPTGAEGALTKLKRVMPVGLRERVRAMEESVVVREQYDGSWPAGRIVGTLSAATQRQQRVHLWYRRENGEETARDFDPYGLVYHHGR